LVFFFICKITCVSSITNKRELYNYSTSSYLTNNTQVCFVFLSAPLSLCPIPFILLTWIFYKESEMQHRKMKPSERRCLFQRQCDNSLILTPEHPNTKKQHQCIRNWNLFTINHFSGPGGDNSYFTEGKNRI